MTLTTTTAPTGVIRSTSRAISNIADTIVETSELAKTSFKLVNKYATAELLQADENIKVSGIINHAENLQTLMSTFSIDATTAETLLA